MRRTVFYIPGFDPRGPVHYHRLYAEEAAKQTAVNGLALTVSQRRNADALEAVWTITSPEAETRYRFMRYEDIIRRLWPRNALQMYASALEYGAYFLTQGVYAMILRNSWPNFIATSYIPISIVNWSILVVLITLGLGYWLTGFIGIFGWLVPLPLLALPFLAYEPIENRLRIFWLARSCAMLVKRAKGKIQGIEERCAAFAERVAAAANDPEQDEVLLVGHSVGAHLVVTIAARALEKLEPGRRFSLLTLGHAIAMTPRSAQAEQFRKDLLAISTSEQVDWIDVTSAIDQSCIALSDPLALSRVKRPDGARVQPKIVSTRFNTLFTPDTYKTVRRDHMRSHFQYLMSAERPGDYDYFLITAGRLTLAERFAHLDSNTSFNRFRMGKS